MALSLLTNDDSITIADSDLPGITNGDPDTTYTLKKITSVQHRAIVKRHTKEKFERGVGRVEKIDALAVLDDILDEVLIAWTGVLLRGEPAPLTRELKLSGLDFERKKALIDAAGMNEIVRAPERRAESFRAMDEFAAVLDR